MRTVVIRGDRIVAIVERNSQVTERNVTYIDGRGKFLLPGLIDMHAHLLSDERIADEYVGAELDVVLGENRTPQLSPSHSWNRTVPSVVSQVKSGAVSPSRIAMSWLLCRRP